MCLHVSASISRSVSQFGHTKTCFAVQESSSSKMTIPYIHLFPLDLMFGSCHRLVHLFRGQLSPFFDKTFKINRTFTALTTYFNIVAEPRTAWLIIDSSEAMAEGVLSDVPDEATGKGETAARAP